MNMKIYRNESVLEAAKNRLRFLFDEFEEVVVNISGGKDSTVVYHLALEIAKEKGRLPLKVLFLDQEAEWQATIDQVRYSMERPEVTPLWYQIPIRLFNATSAEEHWLQCWDPAEEPKWMRPKESYSIKENSYGTDRFTEVFKAIMKKDFGPKSCHIVGVRAEETPARTLGLTTAATYKWITWGKIIDKGRDQYNFYPIYDWGPVDVWKAIHDHNWPYNRCPDQQNAGKQRAP
jgi:predicted phosphoadenosine phosphosulfate sulfurtransferase